MLTWRISIWVAGILAPKFIPIPSLGWMRSTSAFTPSSSMAGWLNGMCGVRRKFRAISVMRRGARLAVRR